MIFPWYNLTGTMGVHINRRIIHFFLFAGFFLSLLFAGCSFGDSGASADNFEDTLPEGTIDFDAINLQNAEYIELSSSTVSFSNMQGKRIFLVTVNTSARQGTTKRYFDVLDASNQRAIVAEPNAELTEELLAGREFEKLFSGQQNPSVPARIEPQIHVELQNSNPNSRAIGGNDNPFELHAPINYELGATREMYVGTGPDPNNTEAAEATLVFKSDICYVWVCNVYLTQGDSAGAQVNAAKCAELAGILEQAILLERNIFGIESDYLSDWDYYPAYPMAEHSPTGTKINILLYDIQGDYPYGSTGGIYGYFTSGDYFPWKTVYNETSHSNGGKFLHLDSAFANKDPEGLKSTVVHEFQHMIHNGMFRSKGKVTETWYNEMCSMLAEDLMQEKLGLDDNAVGKYRFNQFVYSYILFPFFKWDGSDSYNNMLSYANAYGLGYIFSKKYGGADFIYELTHNASSGTFNGFLEVVRRHNPLATKETVLRDIAIEMVTGLYSNCTVESTAHVMNNYKYPMTPVELMNVAWQDGPNQMKGPVYWRVATDSTAAVENPLILEPNQIGVGYIAKSQYDNVVLKFHGTSTSNVKEYILVVD